MRYQQTNERRAVILMVVLSLLTLFALVGVTFVLYADAEAAAARVAREAQTMQTADVKPQEALAFFLSQLIYDVPDTTAGVGSGLRGHSLARTMYGEYYTVPPGPSLNVIPFNGPGRLHYASPMAYPVTPLTNVPPNWGTQLDDYAMVNYTWFSGDGFVRDPERFGVRNAAQLTANTQINPYVGANAPYTYPDLNNFFLAAMRADGTVLTPSYHRPWLFQVVNGRYYAFNDMTNPNWSNPQGKYLTLRPRPQEHPSFPLPGDATGDVKNLPWAPGGNDSIWVDLGAPVMTAPDGTLYKMMFAPLIIDLDGRVNLNTAGNILAYIAAMNASKGAVNGAQAWQLASGAHVSNQGWGPWEVNLSKVLYGDQVYYPVVPPTTPPSAQTTPPTPPEWMRLLTGMSFATTTPPNLAPVIAQPGIMPPTPLPPGLSAWLLPGVHGRYLETLPGGQPLFTPNAAGLVYLNGAPGVNGTYSHAGAQEDFNSLNESNGGATPSSRPVIQTAATPNAQAVFPTFLQGYLNGTAAEGANHPLLYNAFQSPLNTTIATRTFRPSDMEALLRPNAYLSTRPVDANASGVYSDLLRLCPANFGPLATTSLALRFRNLVTTQSWDVGAPGVTPYWWLGMNLPAYLTPNPTSFLLAPYGAQPSQTVGAATSFGFPALPPNPTAGNTPGFNPISSEFGSLDWRALSANSFEYSPTTNPLGYVTPGARIRLNRPLPPYPHMGALLTPPYNSLPPGPTATPYGTAYPFNVSTPPNMANPAIAAQYNQYTAAQNARQALANDIYRRLLAIAGVQPIPPTLPGVNPPPLGTTGNPNGTQLAPRRWLAQLAVNIVDYIDEDDIMTPFNFYTIQDNNNQPVVPPAPTVATQPTTQGPDDTNQTGANPDYWVFGTELPKVVLNEALAEAQQPDPTKAAINGESVKLWIELFNTMPAPGTGGTNTQPQDSYRVPLYVTNPAGPSYSPYRISIAQYTMDRANPPTSPNIKNPPFAPQLPDVSTNVLGKAYITTPPAPATPFPQSTTDVDFSTPVQLSQSLANPPPNPLVTQPPFVVLGSGNTINAGVDPQNFFLIGPKSNLTKYQNPFASPGLPINIPVLQTDNVTYTPNWTAANSTVPGYDERTYGLTVMLRRLANPYLPLQTNPLLPYYNPYVTVDYIQSVPLQSSNSTAIITSGKTQPYAGLNLQPPSAAGAIVPPPVNSPVQFQQPHAVPPPPPGATTTNKVVNTFGYANYPLPPSGHYDWLVHLDRPPISPMELLHVSAWPPYKLTQQFMLGADNTPTVGNIITTFAHYAPWFDGLPLGTSLSTPGTAVSCPWWFDPNLPAGSSHRLYRLFEFLECGDRALGVNGLGRIPGKININTIWDSEILQALIDANLSMGINANPAGTPLNPADPVFQIFTNMMLSRSPAYYNMGTYINAGTLPYPTAIGPVNMGTGLDDRPFMPLSMGQYLAKGATGGLQFPNGFSVTTDTLLRTNNPFSNKGATGNMLAYPLPQSPTTPLSQWLLFENYHDPAGAGLTTSAVHPYYQTQLLTKLYNNVTTRSNTFAVFLTVGFFQVIPGGAVNHPNIPRLGPEIGRSEGKQIRHRMFALVDRTNLTTFTTTGAAIPPATAVTGPTPSAVYPSPPAPLNLTGVQTIQLPAPVPPANTTVTVNPTNPAQLLVANPATGMPGVIQAGTQLVIDAGNINEETVTVISVTPPPSLGTAATLTANFTLPHGVGNTPFTIMQRGNPGPRVLRPYDPRLDFGVVQYFSIID